MFRLSASPFSSTCGEWSRTIPPHRGREVIEKLVRGHRIVKRKRGAARPVLMCLLSSNARLPV
jgi:hypothetical protein